MDSAVVKSVRRWYWQRITAMLMAAFVLIHIAVIVYAIQGGVSAAEIFARTRANMIWAIFYTAFVVLVSIHASIGARAVLIEWCRLRDGVAGVVANALALILLVLGCRAVWAVTLGGPL